MAVLDSVESATTVELLAPGEHNIEAVRRELRRLELQGKVDSYRGRFSRRYRSAEKTK